jgi:hypothetical protein
MPAARRVSSNMRLYEGQRVEYYSKTHGRWTEAYVERVRVDGLVRLDIKRRADPLDIRAYRGPAVHHHDNFNDSDDDDSDDDDHDSVASDASSSRSARSARSASSSGSNRTAGSRHSTPPQQPKSYAAHEPSLSLSPTREPPLDVVSAPADAYTYTTIGEADTHYDEAEPQLPPGWEARVSQGTGEVYYVDVVTEESTYVWPLRSALPDGWTHGVSRSTGCLYFTNPAGESMYAPDAPWNLPRAASERPLQHVPPPPPPAAVKGEEGKRWPSVSLSLFSLSCR